MNDDRTSFYDELSRLNNELVNAQRRLAKQNAELERLNRIKSLFLGMAAHDLRKPIVSVVAYADLLLEDLDDCISDRHRQYVENILRSSERMRTLINDFLDVALIESGQFNLNRTVCSINDIADSVLTVIRPIATPYNTTISTDIDADIGALWLDVEKMEQVLLNIVGNAVEHCDRGALINITARRTASTLYLEISDNGPGIPMDKMASLFELSDKRRTRKRTGERSIGLGLVIAKKIVDAHDGDITVKSSPETGTTFTVIIRNALKRPPVQE